MFDKTVCDPNKNYYQCPDSRHIIKCKDPINLSSVYWRHFNNFHHIDTDEGEMKLLQNLHAAAESTRKCICCVENIKAMAGLTLHKSLCSKYIHSNTK